MEYRVTYDPVADALYVKVMDGTVADSVEIRENVVADFNGKGEIIGVEVLNFSRSPFDVREILMKGVEIVAKP